MEENSCCNGKQENISSSFISISSLLAAATTTVIGVVKVVWCILCVILDVVLADRSGQVFFLLVILKAIGAGYCPTNVIPTKQGRKQHLPYLILAFASRCVSNIIVHILRVVLSFGVDLIFARHLVILVAVTRTRRPPSVLLYGW